MDQRRDEAREDGEGEDLLHAAHYARRHGRGLQASEGTV
jgi:hypothetical protein